MRICDAKTGKCGVRTFVSWAALSDLLSCSFCGAAVDAASAGCEDAGVWAACAGCTWGGVGAAAGVWSVLCFAAANSFCKNKCQCEM
jgi:hypothetical protein